MDWLGVAAFAVSLIALFLSWLAYRQRIKYHPKPNLVATWEKPPLEHFAARVRQAAIVNYGDATARDLVVRVRSSARGNEAWDKKSELAPGDVWWVMAPMQRGADWGYGAEGLVLRIEPGGGAPVAPELLLTWREAPFADKPKRRVFHGPTR